MTIIRAILFTLLTLILMRPAAASTHRSASVKNAFQREHPCPSTGKRRGACHGYVKDHIKPLCAGGPDRPENMQWQTVADAKAKDRLEWRECRKLKATNAVMH